MIIRKKYILIKNIQHPTYREDLAGMIFTKKNVDSPDAAYISDCERITFHPSVVENNTEWFKLEEVAEPKKALFTYDEITKIETGKFKGTDPAHPALFLIIFHKI